MKIQYRGVDLEFTGVPTPAALEAAYQQHVERLKAASAAKRGAGIERHAYGDEAPLSSGQQRLWFLQAQDPSSVAFNVPRWLRIRGALDVDRLRTAVQRLVDRHEVLRTVMPSREGAPYQKILPVGTALAWTQIDASTLDDDEMWRRIDAFCWHAFDLAAQPPLRVALVRVAPDHHILVLVLHHVAMDVWSDQIIRAEVFATYAGLVAGRLPDLPELPIQYADFAIWEAEQLKGDAFQQGIAFWRGFLDGAPEALNHPASRPAGQIGQAETLRASWHGDILRRLDAVATQENTTLFVALAASFLAFLAHEVGQPDVLVGVPTTTRSTVDLQKLVGFFPNRVVLRGRAGFGRTLREAIREQANAWQASLRHQWIPFQEVLNATRVGTAAVQPEVAFTYQHELADTTQATTIAGVEVSFIDRDQLEPMVPLEVQLSRVDGQLTGFLRFDSHRFDRAAAQAMLRRLGAFLDAASQRVDDALGGLLPPGQLPGSAFGETSPLAFATVLEAFDHHVTATPDALAVVDADTSWSYAELNRRSDAVAASLAARGVRRGDRVGVHVGRSARLAAILLGVVKSGAAFVSLDPAQPLGRLEDMANDSGVACVVTDDVSAWQTLGVLADDALAHEPSRPPVALGGDDALYVLYTSGSTGRPKGVVLGHHAMVNHVTWWAKRHAFGPDERFAWQSSYGFDMSMAQFFAPLCNGATLVAISEAHALDPALLARDIRVFGVTRMRLVPTSLQMLLEEPEFADAQKLSQIFPGGEVLTEALRDRFFQTHPHARVTNFYGPTEACVTATCNRTESADSRTAERPPIGLPILNARTYVLDGLGHPVATDVEGELHLAGAGLAHGYAARPRLTALAFVPDPYADSPGARMYRSGDRVTTLADGRISYLGRRDHQLQLRGVRVELAEIEAVVERYEGVVRAAVVPINARNGRADAIAAFVVLAGQATLDATALRDFLLGHLASAVVPGTFIQLPELPLTASGKIDRKQLPDPLALAGPATIVEPSTPTQTAVHGLWCDLLGVERVSIVDHFFVVGGHSLLAVRLAHRLAGAFEREVRVADILEYPTIESFSAWLEAHRGSQNRVERHTYGDEVLASAEQRRMWYLQKLRPESVAYHVHKAVWVRGDLDETRLQAAFDHVVRRHEILRTSYPERGGEVVQRIHADGPRLEVIDAGARQAAVAVLRDVSERPFDLEREIPVRGLLVRSGPSEALIALVMHHIASDDWTSGVLLQELVELYAGHESPPPLQYADYALWQAERLESGEADDALAFWRQTLEGFEREAAWPLRGGDPGPAHVLEVRLDEHLVSGARTLASRHKTTAFVVLQTLFSVYLARVLDRRDVVVGIPTSLRERAELARTLGMFLNTIPSRMRFGLGQRFDDVLEASARRWDSARDAQWIPFDVIVRECVVGGRLDLSALFTLVTTDRWEAGQAGFEIEAVSEVLATEAKVPVSAWLQDSGTSVDGFFVFDPTHFSSAHTQAFAAGFLAFVRRVLERPQAAIGAMPWQTHLPEASFGQTAKIPETTVVAEFEQRVDQHPQRVAVVDETTTWTYSQLDMRANQVAHALTALGVEPGARVGVHLPRSAELAAVLLGVAKTGAAFVSLDPTLPRTRLQAMAQDAQVAVVVSSETEVWEQPTLRPSQTLDAKAHRLDRRVTGDHVLYVLFTSGSTGRPKGVALPHRAMVNHVHWWRHRHPFDANDRFAWQSSYGFDMSMAQFFAPLCNGIALVAISEAHALDPIQLAQDLERFGVTRMRLVPTSLQMLLDEPRFKSVATLRAIYPGGEVLTQALRDRFFEVHPQATVTNFYGPTEACVTATCNVTESAQAHAAERPPIGRPILNARTYVLDGGLGTLPEGVEGELYIGGAGVAQGYWQQPRLTARTFLPDVGGAAGSRMYRSGDRVVREGDGRLTYLGRRDHQLQLRGVRVELAEIEAAIERHPGVARAAVVPVNPVNGRADAIEAFLTVLPNQAVDLDELRHGLQAVLASSVIPGRFVVLDELPTTSSGKVDRNKLQVSQGADDAEAVTDLPVGETEAAIAEIWCDLLSKKAIGRNADFFAVGGHSLLAVRVRSHIESRFGVQLGLLEMVSSATIAGLAALVDARSQKSDDMDLMASLLDELEGLED